MKKKKRSAPTTDRPFEKVWRIVMRVPRGRVVTYGMIATMIERRLTAIAVGWALRAAPPGLLPWHRVVNASGGLSTDRTNPGRQRALLEAEGVVFEDDGTIDLERHLWRPRARPSRSA